MSYKALVSLAVIFCGVSYANGCACPAVDKITMYCNLSDYGLRGTPYETYTPEFINGIWYRKYYVNIHYVFKGFVPSIYVYTPVDSAQCGIYFQSGQEYLISGYIMNGRMFANVCGWNEPWFSIPFNQRCMLYNPLFCQTPLPLSPISLLSKLPRRIRKEILD